MATRSSSQNQRCLSLKLLKTKSLEPGSLLKPKLFGGFMSKIFELSETNPNFPQVLDVTPMSVWKLKDQVKLVDVRRSEEYTGELGHVPGAQLLTLDDLPNQMDQLPKDQPIVFICRSGGRSAQASAFALENGFNEVYNMQGGMLRWNEEKFETEK